MSVCSSCGQENPAIARFCLACATPLASQPGREERKVVTVLFADLVGFTARAETLDPEEVRAILAPYYSRLRAELERFGGTVEKFIGDAVMAVFGAPVAHEDDPERAVRAALAIRDWAIEEASIQVRIAVHTGEALVSLGARPAAGEGMVAGDVVNTAARLQAAASVNGILVGEQTFRATERVVEYREHEPVLGKGKSEPIRVWEAVQTRSRVGVDVRQHGRAALVGRDDELELLERALRRATREREPQLVTLVGVPGIGKSRLLFELFRKVDAGAELVSWRQGRSLPYGEGIAFWALGEMVKAQSGILETDSPAVAEAKLSGAVEAVVSASEAAWVERNLRPLVGLAAENVGTGPREEAFAAWRHFLEAIAEQGPLVLVFEDLHWAEDALLDFVDELVEWVSGVPLLVLASARPELLTRRPSWGGGKPSAATVRLSSLSDQDTASLVHALLERGVLPTEVQQALLLRAGGNPLYAEEFVHALAERGFEEFGEAGLPESVQGLIAGRLDGLPVDEKALLQDATVLGKVFWSGALRTMSADGRDIDVLLHALERKEFVRRERRSTVADEREYAFRHVLVRDLAYAQIPRALRSDKHRAAAGWLQSLGRPEDHADLLAHHLVAALEYASQEPENLSTLAAEARLALRDAGERALSLSAFAAATRFFEQALALWPQDDQKRPYLLLLCGRARAQLDLTGADLLAEAAEGLLALGDEVAAAEAEMVLGEIEARRGHQEGASARFDRSVELIGTAPPSPTKARVLSTVARFRALALDPGALDLARAALALAEQFGLDDVRAQAHITIGTARNTLGSGDGGIGDIEAGIAIAEAAGSPEAGRGYTNLGAILAVRGDPRVAEVAEGALRTAERFGIAHQTFFAKANLASIAYPQGRWDDALGIANELIAAADAGNPHILEPMVRSVRALIRLARGDDSGATEDAARALELSRNLTTHSSLTRFHCAWVAAATGDLGLARELVEEFGLDRLATRADNETHVLALVAELGLAAEYLRVTEKRTTENRPFRQAAAHFLHGDYLLAADVYDAIGNRSDEAFARLRAAKALAAEGRRAESNAELQQALAFYRSVGATRYTREAEALLAASA